MVISTKETVKLSPMQNNPKQGGFDKSRQNPQQKDPSRPQQPGQPSKNPGQIRKDDQDPTRRNASQNYYDAYKSSHKE